MPRAALTAGAHRTDSSVDRFDPLKFDANGEEARILIPSEDNAWAEWVHNLNVPVFEEGGAPLMGTKEVRGVSRAVFEDVFLGKPICLGREDVLAELHLDIERCPVCAGVKRMMDAGIADAQSFMPQQRFALPIIRYDTQNKRSAATLRNPPGAKILVWSLSSWTYRRLDNSRSKIVEMLDLQCGPEGTKLQMVDFALHCEFAKWQKIDEITPLRRAIDRSDVVKAVVAAVWGNKENHPTDDQLQAACGRKSDREWMVRDIADAEEAWARAVHWGDGGPLDASKGTRVAGGRNLDAALDDLMAPAEPGADPLAGHPGGMDEFAAQPAAAASPAGDDLFAAPAPSAAPASANGTAAAASWPSDDDLFASPAPAAPAPAAAANSAAAALDTVPAVAAVPAANGAAAAPAVAAGKVASFDEIMPL